MAEFELDEKELFMEQPNTDKIFKNVKEIKASDGSWRFSDGALIITDETGTDRVLIGFGEGLF